MKQQNVVPFEPFSRDGMARRGAPDKTRARESETIEVECPSCSAVLCLDMSTWGLAWLDAIHMENSGKSGDSEKRMLVGEWTLVAKAPTANTKLTNVT